MELVTIGQMLVKQYYMLVTLIETKGSKRLIDGRIMICPRCKREHDILQYKRLELIEEFVRDTTPIYKCPSCKWLFAPADDLVAFLLGRTEGS